MKRTHTIRLLSLITVLTMLIPSMIISVPAAATDAPTEESFYVGEEIYSPELSGKAGTLPEGWLAGPATHNPWANKGGSDGWASYDESSTKNSAINTKRITRSSSGVNVNLATGDFSIVFPALKDSEGNDVTDYAYTVKVSYPTEGTNGSFGLITDAVGSDRDFRGGNYFMLYAASKNESYRYYNSGATGTRKDFFSPVKKTDANALKYPDNGSFTVTVYHTEGKSYCFVNGAFVCSGELKDYYSGAVRNGIGMHFSATKGLIIKEITVNKVELKKDSSADMKVARASVRYCDADGRIDTALSSGLRFCAEIDKTSRLYTKLVPEKNYSPSNENVKFGMIILPTDRIPKSGKLTIDTPRVLDVEASKLASQDDNTLTFWTLLTGIPENHMSREFSARVYVKVKNGNEWEYTYSEEIMSLSYSDAANMMYEDVKDETVRARLDAMFESSPTYLGANNKFISFALFSDLHYVDTKYMTPVSDVESIMKRASEAKVDFVLQGGDFCNDFIGSPEIVNAYLNNKYDLPAYGIMGNHDLEGSDKTNSMSYVTSKLTNREVVWGTEDGKLGDGSIAYYYYEINGFRIICCDSNYYYNTKQKIWKHYPSWYSGPPASEAGMYEKINSLGPDQLEWLERVLTEAANDQKQCIVVTHASVAGNRGSSQSSDHAAVRDIYARVNGIRKGTVLMSINGHHHSNHIDKIDGVLYFDVNTVRNGAWYSNGQAHYNDEHTFDHVTYDKNGNMISSEKKKLSELAHGAKTWFFEEPLSAIVKVYSSGRIVIEGTETNWMYGIDPGRGADGEEPKISSGIFDIAVN